MTSLTLDRVACSTPDGTILFSDLTISIEREAVGLVGRNGSGKSTLLRAIGGEVPAATGRIRSQGRVGYLRQLPTGRPSIAKALGIAPDLTKLWQVETGDMGAVNAAAADWKLRARIQSTLASFGLDGLDLNRDIKTLSGGEQTRVMLAALMLQEPDLVLLDEPTNNLDEDGRRAVQQFLQGWVGPALVASHDRQLLEPMDRIVELSPVGVRVVRGGWSEYERERDAAKTRAVERLEEAKVELMSAGREKQREVEKQARRDRHGRKVASRGIEPKMYLYSQQQRAERTAARYRAVGHKLVTRARTQLDEASADVERLVPIRIDLPPSGLPSRHQVVTADGVTLDRDGARIFGPLDISLQGPERVALLGRNGSGKSSLLRLLAGDEAPTSGTLIVDRSRVALLDQRLALLSEEETVLAAMERHNRDMDRREAHAALAAYGFRNRWASRRVGTLSGGERVRLALACLFAGPRPPWLVLLDEPTNHLDLDATRMLETALCRFDAALICVSHDPVFRTGLGLTREMHLG